MTSLQETLAQFIQVSAKSNADLAKSIKDQGEDLAKSIKDQGENINKLTSKMEVLTQAVMQSCNHSDNILKILQENFKSGGRAGHRLNLQQNKSSPGSGIRQLESQMDFLGGLQKQTNSALEVSEHIMSESEKSQFKKRSYHQPDSLSQTQTLPNNFPPPPSD